MAFETIDIEMPPANLLDWVIGGHSFVVSVYFKLPVFRVIEQPYVFPRYEGVRVPKLSLSRTRDRFSMMTEGHRK
jgi:hypothetical protein